MTDDLATAISGLQEAVRLDAIDCTNRIDDAVERIIALRDERAIGPMLLVLDDTFSFQELMWSVMHGAESFDAAAYVAALVDVLPPLEGSAPEWAYRLVGRVLNGDAYRILLAERLKQVGSDRPDLREAISRTLTNLLEEHPGTFDGKAAEVRAIAGF